MLVMSGLENATILAAPAPDFFRSGSRYLRYPAPDFFPSDSGSWFFKAAPAQRSQDTWLRLRTLAP